MSVGVLRLSPYSAYMSDLDPTALDIAKVGGGGALASLLTVLAGRIFGSQDKVLARLDVVQATMSDLSQKLAVLTATSERRDSDNESIKAQVKEHGERLARIEATLEKLK